MEAVGLLQIFIRLIMEERVDSELDKAMIVGFLSSRLLAGRKELWPDERQHSFCFWVHCQGSSCKALSGRAD